jgi:hypothetical protein
MTELVNFRNLLIGDLGVQISYLWLFFTRIPGLVFVENLIYTPYGVVYVWMLFSIPLVHWTPVTQRGSGAGP